jgi:hypothetical protein
LVSREKTTSPLPIIPGNRLHNKKKKFLLLPRTGWEEVRTARGSGYETKKTTNKVENNRLRLKYIFSNSKVGSTGPPQRGKKGKNAANIPILR